VAANREWVVPSEPEKSYLWALVRDGDMPAKGAKAGPLSAQEKEAVRAWIAAGAPVPAVQASATPAPEPTLASQSFAMQLLGWLGKFHILVIHFPIALLMAAALGELVAVRWRSQVPLPAVRFAVLLGAAGAVAAVVLGWLHADVGGHGSASSGLLGLHRWLGTLAGFWALGTLWCSERDSWRGERSVLFRVLLWSGTLLVIGAAHFGGLLVHGVEFFAW
jgi:hypothetical protein